MAIISIRRFLSSGAPEPEPVEIYRRVIGLFLQAIGLHAVNSDQGDYDRFRADIAQLEAAVEKQQQIGELLVTAGAALKALEEYNLRTNRFLRLQSNEMQAMVSMLTKTILSITSGSDVATTRLGDIEKQLEKASHIEDVRVLKARLGDCLEAVRAESVRQKTTAAAVAGDLLSKVPSPLRQEVLPTAEPNQIDHVTGLPDRESALYNMRSCIQTGSPAFAAMAVVERVQSINSRFGYTVGDSVLQSFTDHFAQLLNPEDKLFRWQGPALIAIMKRAGALESVRKEVRRMADMKLQKTIDVGTRTVLMPVSAVWSAFEIAEPISELTKRLDGFVASQGPRGFS